MKQMVLFSLMLLSAVGVGAQFQHLDSLINALNTKRLTEDKQLELLKEICFCIPFYDIPRRNEYAKRALSLAEKGNDKISASWIYNSLAGSYDAMAIYDTSMLYFEKALVLAKEIKNAEREIAYTINIGNSYVRQGKFILAIKCYTDILPLCEANPDNEKIVGYHAGILGNIAELYLELKNTDRALYYINQSETCRGFSFFQTDYVRGRICFERGEYEKALEYELKAFNSLGMEYPSYSCLTAQVASLCYIALGNYDKASEYARQCLHYADLIGDPKLYVRAYNTLSNVYGAQNRWEECEAAALKAWAIDSLDVDNSPDIIRNIIIANIRLGNKSKAEAFLAKSDEIKKRHNDSNFRETLMDMEVKYETDKKETRIATLEKERQLYVWLGVASVLLMISLVIVLWQTKRNAQKEKQLIATRSVLDGEMRERARLAQDLHDRLSGNLSAVKFELGSQAETLQNVSDKLDNCIRDIRDAAHNLMPASLQSGMKVALEDYAAQFPNVKFHFFGQEKRIEERLEFVVYCCASELINNAVKHSGAESINLQLVQDEKHVTFTVSDNGCGYDDNASVKGLGLKSIRDRVTSCNGKIDIVTSPGKGTETTIELKTNNS